MKILDLNCQHAEQPKLKDFLRQSLDDKKYDILLLQEVEEKVLALLDHHSYTLVRSFNEEIGDDSQLCIAYKKEFTAIGTGFKSFSSMRRDPVRGLKHPCFGVLWVDISIESGVLRAASTHLHSGTNRRVRLKELQIAKDLLLNDPVAHTLLAGDFNAGFPGEPKDMAKVLAPEFVWTTKNCGPTLDSRYCENTAHLPSRISAFLSVFNIGIHLRCDHVFFDRKTAESHDITCSVLPDRVSDHSPVEFLINFE